MRTRDPLPDGHVVCPTCSGDKGWEVQGGDWDEYLFDACETCNGDGHLPEDEADDVPLYKRDMREAVDE